jgi:hypothetical protein
MKAEFISRRRLSARLLSAAVVSFPALAAAKDWIAGDGSWTAPGNWNPSGMPGAGDIVNIVDSDGVNRVINYDYTGPLFGLGQLTLDLTNYSGTTSNILTLSNINLDLAVDSEIIGNTGSGKVVLTTGANNIANGNLYLGNGIGSVGAYSLGGAGFAVLGASANEFVGVGGTGIFNQTGGNNNISSGTLDLAQSSGSTGSYALSGTGTVTVSAEIIGDEQKFYQRLNVTVQWACARKSRRRDGQLHIERIRHSNHVRSRGHWSQRRGNLQPERRSECGRHACDR